MNCLDHDLDNCPATGCRAAAVVSRAFEDALNAQPQTQHGSAAVEALTAELHAVDCLPNAATTTRWSDAHWQRDEAKARRILDGLAARWQLTRNGDER